MTDPDAEFLQEQLREVVENQLRDNDPPETRATLDRLLADGHSEADAKRMIASVVVAEVYGILGTGQPFDHDRYTAALAALPQLPF